MEKFCFVFIIITGIIIAVSLMAGAQDYHKIEIELKEDVNEDFAHIIAAFVGAKIEKSKDKKENVNYIVTIEIEKDKTDYLLLFHKLSHTKLVGKENVKKAKKRESEIKNRIKESNSFQKIDEKTLVLQISEAKEVISSSLEVIYNLRVKRTIPALNAYIVKIPGHPLLYRKLLELSPVIDGVELNTIREIHWLKDIAEKELALLIELKIKIIFTIYFLYTYSYYKIIRLIFEIKGLNAEKL